MLVVIETHNIAVFIATSAASAWKHSSAAGAGSCSKPATALLYNIGVDGLLFMSHVQTEEVTASERVRLIYSLSSKALKL